MLLPTWHTSAHFSLPTFSTREVPAHVGATRWAICMTPAEKPSPPGGPPPSAAEARRIADLHSHSGMPDFPSWIFAALEDDDGFVRLHVKYTRQNRAREIYVLRREDARGGPLDTLHLPLDVTSVTSTALESSPPPSADPERS